MDELLHLFNRRDWVIIGCLILMMLVAGVLESFGIGLIFPLMSILSNPGEIYNNQYLKMIHGWLDFESDNFMLMFLALIYWLILAVKNLFIGLMFRFQRRFLAKKRLLMFSTFYQAYLKSPYTYHLRTNSAVLMRNIGEVGSIFDSLLVPLMNIITESIKTIAIVCILLLIETWVVVPTIIYLCVSIILLNLYFRKKLKKLGKEKLEGIAINNKSFFQGIGAIKDVQVLKRENVFIEAFESSLSRILNAVTSQAILGQIPRLLLEVVGVSAILIVMFVVIMQHQDLSTIVPTLSLLAMAGLRLMPSLSGIATSINQLSFNSESIKLVYKEYQSLKNLVDTPSENSLFDGVKEQETVSLPFTREIEVHDVSYRYPENETYVLKNVTLEIPKAYSIAVVGPSGAGKTTLIDLLLGLLPPESGQVLVDGKDITPFMTAWRKNIGYVPQAIYICDDTVRGNIAFGIPEELIDDDAVENAARTAQLMSVITQLPEQWDTLLGEHGVRLSGGQRQRIGIARALYHNPEILVLDEATSSLDGETEREVASAIETLSDEKTMVIIAHRLSTIKHCDRVYFIDDGMIVDYGEFDELMDRNRQFRKMAGVLH